MLAIVTLQLKNSDKPGWMNFAHEMTEFGWQQNPFMPDTFVAEFADSAPRDGVLATIHSDIGMSLSVADADGWYGSIGLARRRPSSVELSWD